LKILIYGLPGSGKTTLAKPLAQLLSAVHINADEVREKYNDWDFTIEGRMRQATRMKHLADGVVMAGKIAVVDFVCPTNTARELFDPDFIIWMDTIDKGPYADTNDLFEIPDVVHYRVSEWFEDTHEVLIPVLKRYMERSKCV